MFCQLFLVALVTLDVACVSARQFVDQKEAEFPTSNSKRDLIMFNYVVGCVMTEKSSFDVAYDMNGYGCYCGTTSGLPEGTQPVDKLDECCKAHDDCWGKATASFAAWYSPCDGYWNSYTFDCGSSTCQTATTDDWYSVQCSAFLCECDFEFATCVKANYASYNYKAATCNV